jgi:hypothetical protein
MSANQKSSVTTTNLRVGDSNDSRIATQSSAMADAASEGIKLPTASRYAGKPGINSGIAASQPSELRPVRVQQTSHKALEGSFAGNDFRRDVSGAADAAMSRIANPPGPREQMREARLTSKLDSPAPQSFTGSSADSDQGN